MGDNFFATEKTTKDFPSCPPCPPPLNKPFSERFQESVWNRFLYFATTMEVLIRGFSLGFGIRMLQYIFFPDNVEVQREKTEDIIPCFKRRLTNSAIAGLSTAAFIYGLSLFVPMNLRE